MFFFSKYKLSAILVMQVLLLSVKAQNTITTVVGTGIGGFSGDGGLAINAEIYGLALMTFDTAQNLYITDWRNHRIRKINSSGIINTVAGTGTAGYNGDGGLATAAQLNYPAAVAFDKAGNLYIADQMNYRIRMVDKTSGVITTVVGTGISGYSGDGGPASAAKINHPTDIIFDASNNLFIADEDNHRVRKVDKTSGIITTVAGNGTAGYGGDNGTATSAQLNYPAGLVFDGTGNLYISEFGDSYIRKVDTFGIITTIAGTGTAGYNGDGLVATAAQLNGPGGLAIDVNGNLFIADIYNSRVRKIDGLGIITTIAGNGTAGYSGDGGPATSAELNEPIGLALDTLGSLFIADNFNNRVRKVANVTGIQQLTTTNKLINIFPNPANEFLYINLLEMYNQFEIKITDILGEEIKIQNNLGRYDVTGLKNGIYFFSLKTEQGVQTKKIIIQH